MATSLAAPASAPEVTQAPSPAAPQAAESPPPAPGTRPCANCGAAMGPAQDWCLECGAGAPGSLGADHPSWRTGAAVAALAAALVLGAAAAGYAALNKGKSPAHVVTIAQSTTPAASATGGAAGAGAAGGLSHAATPGQAGLPVTPKLNLHLKLGIPKTLLKAPKIPLTAITPTPTSTTPTTTTKAPSIKVKVPSVSVGPTTTNSFEGPQTGGEGTSAQPEAILLDTDAASTYNPNALPASGFGDPSLTIDEDTSTAWTAQVEPALAPRVQAGVALDLKSPRKISALKLITDTPGMTIQVLATTASTLPAAITDPAWVKLSSSAVETQRRLRIALRDTTTAFRFVLLWISRAPAASVGTPQAPGHVSINELEVFPAG